MDHHTKMYRKEQISYRGRGKLQSDHCEVDIMPLNIIIKLAHLTRNALTKCMYMYRNQGSTKKKAPVSSDEKRIDNISSLHACMR